MTEDLIDLIANDGCRNAAGGIYSTRVYEFANAIEAEATAPLLARIAELEAQIATVAPAVDAQPVAEVVKWQTFTGHTAWDFKVFDKTLEHGQKLYTYAQSEGLRKDAERYRWLRDTLHGAKAGGGVEVNDALQVYQQPVKGEEVRIYWYLHTPVGFHEITAATIDDAIDEGMADKDPQ